jgi:hypothetical protein
MTDQHTANYDLDENEDYYDGTSSLDRFHYSQLASSSSLQKSPRTRLEQQYDLTMQIDDDGDAPAANKNDFPQLVDDSSECISFPPTPCKVNNILYIQDVALHYFREKFSTSKRQKI